MSLRIAAQPLRDLAGILSHSPASPVGYRWYHEPLRGPDADRFVLRRDRASRIEEQQEIHYQGIRVSQLLRLLRDRVRGVPGTRLETAPDLPPSVLTSQYWQPQLKALASLSDQEMDRLVLGESIPVDPALFPEAALAHQQKQATLGGTFPFRPALEIEWKNENGGQPREAGLFYLKLEPVTDIGVGWNQYGRRSLPDYGWLSEQPVNMEPYALTAEVTREQKGDVGFVLQGSFRDIVTMICRIWDYRVAKVRNVYYFWPHAWGVNRLADIPEADLERWRRAFQSHGTFTLEDRVRMATRYTQPQLSLTMRVALRQAGRWPRSDTLGLRIIGLLTPKQRSAVTGSPGVPLETLMAGNLGATLQEWMTFSDGKRIAWKRARLHLMVGPPWVGRPSLGLYALEGERILQVTRLELFSPGGSPNAHSDQPNIDG